ncbi:MAG: VOC family protein [Sphingobacteriales bacterium]|nr:MAG: VOC family protein [Sphingobacteriales bacterium]
MKRSFVVTTAICIMLSFTVRAQSSKTKAVINHIAVYVVDLKKSTGFYRDIIGLDTIPEPFHDGRHTWFAIGTNAHLHVISGASAVTIHDKNSHLCFSVPSVPEFIKILDQNHIAYENWLGEKQAVTNRVDGVKQIYFTDPDGYWIEINDAKK